MFMFRSSQLLLFLCVCTLEPLTSVAEGLNSCCDEPNLIQKNKCWNEVPINLSCPKKYLLDPDFDESETFRLSSSGDLMYRTIGSTKDVVVPKEEFCLTSLESENGSKVAIICMNAEQEESLASEELWFTLRAICGFISVIFLCMTLFVYALVPNLRDLQGKCIMHAIASLALSLLCLGIIQLFSNLDTVWCLTFAYINYFAFMTTFFWLHVTSIHVWKTATRPHIMGTDRQWYMIYLIYGHGMPIVLLTMLAIANHTPGDHLKPNLATGRCWFNGQHATWAYFYGPISILLCINLVLFLLSIKAVWRETKNINDAKVRSLKFKIRLYVRLFLIMGLLWFFEVISVALNNVHRILNYVWVVTDYVNVLQGVLIFLLLVVFRKRALRGLANKGFYCFQFPGMWKTFVDEEQVDEYEREDEVQMSNNDRI
ncbi:PREDICTED: G-protein coupled receptor Mth2-like [Nicrophorus vespilloides]|uniref:G-protein coupled receptor Mth2-like n=1 Tax=Nicrophorus vespilloides TaxID=110193 RepID=A0ABM1M1V4_NICVS|nr:PREDICTED: G-protein coupled receptor Mth2-like [Nicrophorus vespilloides]